MPFALAASGERRRHARPSLPGAGADPGPRLRRLPRRSCAAANVVLDARRAQRLIARRARAAAREREGLRLKPDPGLLDEVTGLVEWPVRADGPDRRGVHATLPPEVLTTSMRTHQRYFACTTEAARSRRSSSRRQHETADGGATIVAGNERVLRARLSDARFFWDQDRKRPLESGCPALDAMRVPRRARHARPSGSSGMRRSPSGSCRTCPAPSARSARARGASSPRPTSRPAWSASSPSCRASWAATTRAPGRDRGGGRRDRRAYAPRARTTAARPRRSASSWRSPTSSTASPASSPIGEKPTGSKDPFALRRAALGVIRLVLENKPAAAAPAAFGAALDGYGDRFGGRREPTIADLLRFFADRLKVHLRERGRAARPDRRASSRPGERGRSRAPAGPGRRAATPSSPARTAATC